MEEALDAYRSVATYFPGVEARYRLAEALLANDEAQQARQELEQLLNDAHLAPGHFRKAQKPWLDLARQALSRLET
jgi:hypothetical protein